MLDKQPGHSGHRGLPLGTWADRPVPSAVSSAAAALTGIYCAVPAVGLSPQVCADRHRRCFLNPPRPPRSDQQWRMHDGHLVRGSMGKLALTQAHTYQPGANRGRVTRLAFEPSRGQPTADSRTDRWDKGPEFH